MQPVLDKKIKLIWDFKGHAAAKTAEHHEKHLKEYIVIEELKFNITGVSHINEMHSIAYLVVAEFEMISVRDMLKPHRGEIFND
ncbi:hypothetical protein ACFSQJ_00295 [Croceitalea marina]|uniref:Uncharacterized protein n=1 Tax=Croceitalea marina TaxID=1775166 RepID=A0ABW5MSA7_9FLAO